MNKNIFGNTCVCLARVSTSSQDYQAQIDALHKKAKEFGLKVINDVATKESGFRSFDRKEGFKELVMSMLKNKCHIVLCTELSRLSRRKILLEQIKQWLIDNKIQLWVDDINFQLFNDKGEVDFTTDIVFSVFAAMAESEMKDKKKRMKRGMVELNKSGYSLTGKPTFGYTRIKGSEKIKGKFRSVMNVNEEEAKQVRTVYDWYLNGIDGDPTRCSISQIHQECIARGFGHYLQSRRNVNKCLKNELYTGHVITSHLRKNAEYWALGNKKAQKYVKSGSEMTIAPIISQEIFDAVQMKMKGLNTHLTTRVPNIYADKSRKHSTLLSKLIVCPVCGKFYLGDYRIKGGHMSYNYRCQNHKAHGASFISMRMLDFAVWSFCRDNIGKLSEYAQKFQGASKEEDIKGRIANIQKRKKELEAELENLATRFLTIKSVAPLKAITDKYISESNKLKKDISQCDSLLNKETHDLENSAKAEKLSKADSKTLAFIQSSKEEMRKYIAFIVKEVKPVYHSLNYIVAKVTVRDEKMTCWTVDPNDAAHGLSYEVYLIIYKKDNNRPQFRYISGNCEFDSSSGIFLLPNSDTATLDVAMNDADEVYFKSVPYKPLEIYGEDKPREAPSSVD